MFVLFNRISNAGVRMNSFDILIKRLILKHKASPRTQQLFGKFLPMLKGASKSLELSSESVREIRHECLRPIFLGLKRCDVVSLLSDVGFDGKMAMRLMFADDKATCFGVGVCDDHALPEESRIKIYNFYDQAGKQIDGKQHVKVLARRLGLNVTLIANDFDVLQDISCSAVDIYDAGGSGLKVYSRHFLTRDLEERGGQLFSPLVMRAYRRLLKAGQLPPVFSICIRYNQKKRSVRTDFLCNTTTILPYLEAFDADGTAQRLCADLFRLRLTVLLTYIGIDLDQRPRTQFYFAVY